MSQSVRLEALTDYCSHVFACGNSGKGKSTSVKKHLEVRYFAGDKVIDLLDEFRLEGAFFSLPNTDLGAYKAYIVHAVKWGHFPVDLFKAISAGLLYKKDKERKMLLPGESSAALEKAGYVRVTFQDYFYYVPQGLPTEVLFPALPMSRTLPENFRPYKICFNELELDEFRTLLGRLSFEQNRIVKKAFYKAKSFQGFTEVLQSKGFVERSLSGIDRREFIDLLERVEDLHKQGLICERGDPLALDLDKIMFEKEVITCFTFFNVEDSNLMYLLVAFLLRQIYNLRKNKVNSLSRMYPPMSMGIREVQNVAPARGQAAAYAFEGQAFSTSTLKKIASEPRDIKIRLFTDSQSPDSVAKQVRKFLNNGGSLIYQMDMLMLKAIMEMVYIDAKSMIGIQNAPVGIHIRRINPQSKFKGDRTGIHYPCMLPPTVSRVKGPDDSFFKRWKEAGGKFQKFEFKAVKGFIRHETFTAGEQAQAQEQGKRQEGVLFERSKILVKLLEGQKKRRGLTATEISKLPEIAFMAQKVSPSWEYKGVLHLLDWMLKKSLIKFDVKTKAYSLK